MEKLVINVPEVKSNIVKQILHGLGIYIEGDQLVAKGNYKQKLLNTAVWSDDDLKPIVEGKNLFDNLKAEEW